MSIPQDPARRESVRKVLVELSASLSRIEGERDYIKESINKICEDMEINKKTFRKLVKTYHKQNFSKEVADNNEFVEMYEQITGETVL
jgi:hypothetical protein